MAVLVHIGLSETVREICLVTASDFDLLGTDVAGICLLNLTDDRLAVGRESAAGKVQYRAYVDAGNRLLVAVLALCESRVAEASS